MQIAYISKTMGKHTLPTRFWLSLCVSILCVGSLQAQVSISFTSTAPDCHNLANGSISAEGVGGTAPYTYNWDNGTTGPNLIGVGAGIYFVTVTDNDGNTASDSVRLGQPDPLEAIINPQSSICDGSSGNYLGSGNGGTPPYVYIWSNGDRDSILETPAAGFYALTINDSKGCKAFTTLVVNDPLLVNVRTTDVTCAGACDGSAFAEVSGGVPPYTFLWNWNGNTNQILPNLDPGYYEVTVTDANGCVQVAGDSIAQPDSISLNLTIVYDTCGPGAKATVTANPAGGTPPYTFLWDDGSTDSTAMFMGTSQHALTVTDANNCKADTIFMIYDSGSPMVEIDSINPTCFGIDDGKATAIVTGGTPPYTYLWNTGAMTPMINNLSAGLYTVTVTDANGCMDVDSVHLENEINIELELESTNALCGENGTAAIIRIIGGFPPYSIQWDDPLMQTDSTATGLTPGLYTVKVTDSIGCMAIDSIMVRDSGSVDADFEWEFIECYQNDSMLVQFNDRSSANVNSWFWDFGDGQTSTEQNPLVVLTNRVNQVTLVVSSIEGCRDSVTKEVILPFIDVDLTPDNSEVCESDTLKIMAVNNDTLYPVTCQWWPDSLIVAGQGTNMVQVYTDAPGNYTIFVKKENALGCIDTLSTSYTVKPQMPVADSIDIVYEQCDSFTIDFHFLGDTMRFCWSFGDPNHPDSVSTVPNPSYTYPDTGTYIVTLIPKEICKDTLRIPVYVGPSPEANFTCDFDECTHPVEIQFTDLSTVPDSITRWEWIFSNGDTSGLQNPLISVDTAMILEATLIIHWGINCTDTITKEKTIDPFICYPQKEVVACMGDTTFLNPGIFFDTTYTYNWSPGIYVSDSTILNPYVVLDSSITFQVHITRDSCEKTMEVMVIVPPMINLDIEGDTVVCDAMPVPLVAVADQPVTFEWSEDPDFDVVFSNEDSVEVVPGRPTTYFVRATDTLGCSKIDSITVGNFMSGLQVSNDTMICLGDEIMLSAISLFPNDILTYNWEPDSAIITGDSTGFIVVGPSVNTIYTVTATNQYGCTKTDSIEVAVKNLAEIFTISAEPDTLIAGVIDSSQLMVTDLPGYTYEWSPEEFILGDNTIPDPIAVPNTSRVFSVKITDTLGCMTVLEIPVVVLQVPCDDAVFVPNAFTPNNDDLNDILYARTLGVTNFYFAIYNRWGELVFETNDSNIGWDGTFGGVEVNEDVYGFYVSYTCDDEDLFLKGNVTVLR